MQILGNTILWLILVHRLHFTFEFTVVSGINLSDLDEE